MKGSCKDKKDVGLITNSNHAKYHKQKAHIRKDRCEKKEVIEERKLRSLTQRCRIRQHIYLLRKHKSPLNKVHQHKQSSNCHNEHTKDEIKPPNPNEAANYDRNWNVEESFLFLIKTVIQDPMNK